MDYLIILFNDWSFGSNLQFQNPEKLSEVEDIRVSPTRGREILIYQVMVNSMVDILLENTTLGLASETLNYLLLCYQVLLIVLHNPCML